MTGIAPPTPIQAPLAIGFLGGGMMCQVGHLPFYLADPRCRVAGIAETRPSLVRILSERLGPDRVISDHLAMLRDPSIQAVVICAPRPATGPLTLAAIEAGKHVLAEKPMAHTAAQADRLATAAERARCLYSVGYMKRFDPGIEAAKRSFDRLCADGSLGRLLLARFHNFSNGYAHPMPPHRRPAESRSQRFPEWPLWPDWLPADRRIAYAWFVNAISHDVNLLRLFFPEPVAAVAAECRSEHALAATLRCGEVPIHLAAAKTSAGHWVEGGEFLFERGRLSFALPSPMDSNGVTRVALQAESGVPMPHEPAASAGWAFARQAAGFLAALADGAPMRNPGSDAAADLRLIEDIWRRVPA